MRITRLKLDNWRGVGSRELVFGDGVTILEGPNEIGKSSTIEALRMLVGELDSSAKREVKAVQPAGQDVGSTVEADIEAGPYRFTYAKTFNRGKATTLHVHEPVREQVTGRDAHQRVDALLAEAVDLDLWRALLVDQGEKVQLADLRGSASLIAALDEAAGAGLAGDEDSSILAAAQAEYERYFTLKAGKRRFDDDVVRLHAAEAACDEAQLALAQVQEDLDAQMRLVHRQRDARARMPALKASCARWQERQDEAREVRQGLEAARAAMQLAGESARQLDEALLARGTLVKEVAALRHEVAALAQALEPSQTRLAEKQATLDRMRKELSELRELRLAQRKAHTAARADAHYVRARQAAEALREQLAEVRAAGAAVEQHAAELAAITVDAAGFETLRRAESAVQVAEGQRQLIATRLAIIAEQDQRVELGGKDVALARGEQVERYLGEAVHLRVPGLLDVLIQPPPDAATVAQALADARVEFNACLQRLGVHDVAQAAADLERGRIASKVLDAAKDQRQRLLGDSTIEELEEQRKRLEKEGADYAASRRSAEPLPDDEADAQMRVSALERALGVLDAQLETAENSVADLQEALDAAKVDIRRQEDERLRLSATLDSRLQHLSEARQRQSDEALEAAASEALARARAAEEKHDTLASRAGAFDDVVEGLDNARAALERGRTELADLDRELAVLDDRLRQRQADGRYEHLEAAERERQAARDHLSALEQRAAAAKLLWESLNRHRDEARVAYVQPLKAAVERLGRVVYGADFEVCIGDDWQVQTRTLGGVTLPFEALSVGAREQLGILLRLAAAQIVSRAGGGVPLIIDDALGFSDPERLATMGAAIAAAGRACQIIILTCTPGRFAHVGNARVMPL